MPHAQYLSFSQAARLLRIPRRQLQQQVRSGELPSTEGKIAVDSLRKRYPNLQVEDSAMVERMREIKDTAFARRVARAAYPEPEVMAAQIARQRRELALERGKSAKYEAIVDGLIKRINALFTVGEEVEHEALEEMWAWLREEMQRPHKPS